MWVAATSGCERSQPLSALSPKRLCRTLRADWLTPGACPAYWGGNGTVPRDASSRGGQKKPIESRVPPGAHGRTRWGVATG